MDTAKLFKNGQNEALRLPKRSAFQGTEVFVKRVAGVVMLIPRHDRRPLWSHMTFLLDTNICIGVINREPPVVSMRIRTNQPDQAALSTITQAELEYGVARSKFPDRNRTALLQFLFPFQLLGFDQMAAGHLGWTRSFLESKGMPIGRLDMLFAARTKSRDLVLVTNNEREFRRIEGHRIENSMRA
jgi:tRNA(fMet)-specific endonuclease VapC